MKRWIQILMVCLSITSINAQIRDCGTMQHLQYLKYLDPQLEQKILQNEIDLQHWINNHP